MARRLSTMMALIAATALVMGVGLEIERLRTRSRLLLSHAKRHAAEADRYAAAHRVGVDFMAYLRADADDSRRRAEEGGPGPSPYLWRRRAALLDGAAAERILHYDRVAERVAYHKAWQSLYERAAGRPWRSTPPEPAFLPDP